MFNFNKQPERDDIWFGAKMTEKQFAALGQKIIIENIENEILENNYFKNISSAQNLDLVEVEKWLLNSWNTEFVMRQNESIIRSSRQPFAIQWAFPQAYYSCFTNLLAKFSAIGFSEKSHTAVLKKYGSLIAEGKLPTSLSFYCNGGIKNIVYAGIVKPSSVTQFAFDVNDVDTVNNQICQFLKSTREYKLEERAKTMKKNKNFKYTDGKIKKKLDPNDWIKVSESVGFTSIMDLIYRKRIKANYQSIDTFTTEHLDGAEVLRNLISIVNSLNFATECYIAKAIGINEFRRLKNKFLASVSFESINIRFEKIENVLSKI